jgi:hypothetical protein
LETGLLIRILKPIPLLFRQQGAGPPQGGLGISGPADPESQATGFDHRQDRMAL